MISMSGDIMGGEARTAVINAGYHVPYAGMSAVIARAIRLPFDALPTDESILNLTGIQTIKIMGGNAVVWGARAPSVSSIFQFLHVRRIQSHYVRYFRESQALLEMLFKPNQPLAGERLSMILDNFVNGEYRKGVFSMHLSRTQAVQVYVGLGDTGVSSVGDSKDKLIEMLNGKLTISMRYVPTGIVERISINIGPDILVEQWGDTILQ
jgi:phage tail sheath protein FI